MKRLIALCLFTAFSTTGCVAAVEYYPVPPPRPVVYVRPAPPVYVAPAPVVTYWVPSGPMYRVPPHCRYPQYCPHY